MTTAPDRLEVIRACFREALRLDDASVAALNEQTAATDMKGWDSQGPIRLILALEERFGVQFEDDQIVELVTVEAILRALGPAA